MSRILVALGALYRRWKYVEEAAPESSPVKEAPCEELERLRKAALRERRALEDFRRYRCHALAREREASIRFLEARIQALEMNLRRAV
jgi:hypothetical protein